jgi:hypothetical protein
MKQAILVLHHRGSKGWLEDCLDSIETTYPIIVSNHDGSLWCMGAIKKFFDETDYDEVCILNETMTCKDNSIWEIIFEQHKGKSVRLAQNYSMFIGKYLTKHILPFPEVNNKRDDVILGEDVWCRGYTALQIEHIDIEPLYDTHQNFEEKNGRNNMILENTYFKKWKGHWNLEMVGNQ